MSGLHMIECLLDQTALLRFLRAQGLDDPRRGPDFSYGVHAWLKAAFAELAPHPWRLLADRKRPPRILAYSRVPEQDLVNHLITFADPTAQAVCRPDDIAGKPMPRWTAGRELGFEMICCPVGRKSRQKTEKDVFLLKADHAQPDERCDRATVYVEWARARLEATNAVEVGRIGLLGFRRVHQLRKRQAAPGQRATSHLERPEALIGGSLRIVDPEAFERLLARGVGRHRAFGYGMLLLKPPAR